MITINLDKKTNKLLIDLERNTGISKEKFASNLVNGKDDLHDLKTLNRLLEERKINPHPKRYSVAEASKILGF